MARPRKFIRVQQIANHHYRKVDRGGQEIHGLSWNKTNGQFYSLDVESGKRIYWGSDVTGAVNGFQKSLDPPMTIPIVLSEDEALTKLQFAGVPVDMITDEMVEAARYGHSKLNRDFIERHPKDWLHRILKGNRLPAPVEGEEEPCFNTAVKKLRDALKEWKCWAEAKGRSRSYVQGISRRFEEFIRKVGNKPLNELSADDFSEWRLWVAKRKTKYGYTGKWSNDRHQHVRTVLKIARKQRMNWAWPAGLVDWTSDYEAEYHRPDKSNRNRMPVDVFHKLLAVTEEWKQADPEQFPTNTQQGRARRRQAAAKRREGYLWNSMLKLAINCSLDNVDCTRICWEHIRNLDGRLPYMDFSRTKTRHRTGVVERMTPLLPAVVGSLRQWREIVSHEGFIFRTDRGGPYAKNTLLNAYKKLAKSAEVTGWTFKHIRNVGSSLGKLHKLSRDERDALLGHVVDGQSKFYEEDVDETYLIEIVNLIGRDYLQGDQITPSYSGYGS